jgi:hypothetical protein
LTKNPYINSENISLLSIEENDDEIDEIYDENNLI